MKIFRNTFDQLEFDMIGIDASITNAIRRILLAEVCTSSYISGELFDVISGANYGYWESIDVQ